MVVNDRDQQPRGFLALPANGKGQGVLVLHAWWGLNESMKSFCGRLAQEGYVAFAPDLFHGKVATTIQEAEVLSAGADEKQTKADIARAVDFLSRRSAPSGKAVAVIGFSFGAYFALGLSTEDPERVRAVVIFYGTGGGDFKRSKAAYLGHFAQSDPFEPAAQVRTLEDTLRAAGRPVTFHTYEGTGHWFFEPDRTDAYKKDAAQLAWERTVAFLRTEFP